MDKTKKMKKTMLAVSVVMTLLLVGTLVPSSVIALEEKNSQPLPVKDQLLLRIRNRICDTIGICLGGCELTNLTGILEYDGDIFYIGNTTVHFGPNWYITAAISAEDYDGDGEIELIIDELLGLVDTEVTVEGHYQSDDWMSVFTINELVYREAGQPIWAAQHHWRWRNRNTQE